MLVDDEHVPLAVDALEAVAVGEGGLQALALVARDGAADDVPDVLEEVRAGRDEGDGGPDRLLDVGAGQARADGAAPPPRRR